MTRGEFRAFAFLIILVACTGVLALCGLPRWFVAIVGGPLALVLFVRFPLLALAMTLGLCPLKGMIVLPGISAFNAMVIVTSGVALLRYRARIFAHLATPVWRDPISRTYTIILLLLFLFTLLNSGLAAPQASLVLGARFLFLSLIFAIPNSQREFIVLVGIAVVVMGIVGVGSLFAPSFAVVNETDTTEMAESKEAGQFGVQYDHLLAHGLGLGLCLVPSVICLRDKRLGVPGALGAVACLIGLVFSFSRGSWVGLAAALLVATVLAAFRGHIRIMGGIGFVCAILVVSTILIVRSSDSEAVAATQRRFVELVSGDRETTSAGRLELWRYWARDFAFEHPLAGRGLGYYRELLKTTGINLPHNDILHVAVTTGIAGLVAYVVMWLYIVTRLSRRTLDVLTLSAVLSAVFVLVSSQFDQVVESPYYTLMIGAICWLAPRRCEQTDFRLVAEVGDTACLSSHPSLTNSGRQLEGLIPARNSG